MDRRQIISWLKQDDAAEFEKLWSIADKIRTDSVGEQIHLRGLVEFSNICSRKCLYCGINAANNKLQRYEMTKKKILECAKTACKLGYGTVVLQSGENKRLDINFLAETIKEIKKTTNLAVTLSVGEWDREVYKLWKQAGADRFLLRFETSDDELYRRLHPDSKNGVADRFEKLEILKDLGYEVGSGVMIGLPGQSYDSLADDLFKFQQLDLDMIGVGPYLVHKDTEFAQDMHKYLLEEGKQVPATEEMTYKVFALARILCPMANIPATTALATLNYENGYEKSLACGCNVVMPNITPMKYRQFYSLYQGKNSCEHFDFDMKIKRRIEKISRFVGSGSGASRGFLERTQNGGRL